MAIFGNKKTKTETKAEEKKLAVTETKKPGVRDLSFVLRRPRITEKATMLAGSNAYAFEVSVDATKHDIMAAVKEKYNVTPVKVAIVRIPSKQVIIRNTNGVKRGGKKAYVYLKKGDTIEFV